MGHETGPHWVISVDWEPKQWYQSLGVGVKEGYGNPHYSIKGPSLVSVSWSGRPPMERDSHSHVIEI